MCGQSESVEHLLWDCPWILEVWHGLLGNGDVRGGCSSVFEWLTGLKAEGTANRTQADRRWNVMITACWLIWKARCAGAFQGKPPEPDRLVAAVWKAVSEMEASNSAKLQQHRTTSMQARRTGTPAAQAQHWTPPEEGSVKINCDGAWSSSSGRGGRP